MAGVTLPDRHDIEHARAADLVRPYRLHVGHAGRYERIVQQRRAHHRLGIRIVVRRLGRRAAHHDRMVAVVHALDAHRGRLAFLAGVIAMEFPERALGALVAPLDVPFELDVRGGGIRDAGDFTGNDRHRLAEDRADVVVLAHGERYLDAVDEVA